MILKPFKLNGAGYQLSTTPEAEARKSALLKEAGAITAIKDKEGADVARYCLKEMNEFTTLLEKSRKEVKKPVLEAGDKIDNAAKACAKEVEEQKARITRLITDHAQEQARIQQEALRKQQEAEAELQRKREEEEAKAAEAERLAILAEEAVLDAANKKQREAARKLADEAKKKEDEAASAAMQVSISEENSLQASLLVMSSAPTKGVKPVLDYEVTDIHALYKAYPGLCDITPKRRDILTYIKGCQDADEEIALPGIKIIETYKVSTRGS
jgi:hypothetical protein